MLKSIFFKSANDVVCVWSLLTDSMVSYELLPKPVSWFLYHVKNPHNTNDSEKNIIKTVFLNC